MTARLDYSQPPPGYSIGPDTGDNAGGWFWSRGPQGGEGHRGDIGATEAEVLAAAWSHYKAEHDPPGMRTFSVDGEEVWFHWVILSEARSRGFSFDSRAAARAAAWSWHDRRHALAKRIDEDVICPECRSRDAHVEAIDDETTTQPWCVECDLEMGGMTGAGWPECLLWTDEQADEVERWLLDGRAAFPGVLDDDPCDDDPRTTA